MKRSKEPYVREISSHLQMNSGKWVVFSCPDHAHLGRALKARDQIFDAALVGFWPVGTMLTNIITGQIIRISQNGGGPFVEMIYPEMLTEIQARRYRDYRN